MDSCQIIRRWTLVAVVIPLIFIGNANRSFSQESTLESFRNALIDYFAVLNFVPVLVDRGYTVGDAIEADGVNFMARRSQCFPRLKAPTAVPTALPAVIHTDAVAVSFGLKLRQIFDSSAGADLLKSIELRFFDAAVISVSRFDLKEAMDRAACGEITALVDGTILAVDQNWKPRFVVSEVLFGKREATLTFVDKANLNAKADKLARQIGGADIAVQVGIDGRVTLKSNLQSVIAVKPVTIPKVVDISQLNALRGPNDVELQWDPSDCDNAFSCRQLFAPFVDLLKASEPTLDRSDLEK
jgi:hypothetical protein